MPYVQAFMAVHQRPDLCPRSHHVEGADVAEDSSCQLLRPTDHLLRSLLSQRLQEVEAIS